MVLQSNGGIVQATVMLVFHGSLASFSGLFLTQRGMGCSKHR